VGVAVGVVLGVAVGFSLGVEVHEYARASGWEECKPEVQVVDCIAA
jgi:hypothetical protein